MFLSNRRKCFLFLVFCAGFLSACSTSTSTETSALTGPDTTKAFPFSTKEPSVYQGNVVVTGDLGEQRYFVARKNDKGRLGLFRGGRLASSELHTDLTYLIDHVNKVYAAVPPSPLSYDALSYGLFRGKGHNTFEKLESDESVTRYRVRDPDQPLSDIVISLDNVSGLVVRQEFSTAGENGADAPQSPRFIYEVRDLSLDVDDSVFDKPVNYRQVSLKEYRNFQATGS